MSEELETLERLRSHIVLLEERVGIDKTVYNPYAEDLKNVKSALERKEKLEMAFSLIKNKKVDVWYEIMLSVSYDDYLDQKTDLSEELAKEEYELLEELL